MSGRPRQIGNKIAGEWIEKNNKSKNPLSKKKLAELLNHKHPDIFYNYEQARSAVRFLTRSHGKSNRAYKKSEFMEWKPLTIPKPENNDFSKVDLKAKKIVILSDIHLPYYDEAALNAALKYAFNWKPDLILLNGDLLDMYHASDYERDPRQRSLKYEIDMCRQFIQDLRAKFPKSRIVFKYGNHDERYEKKILQRIPEFIDMEWTQLENVLEAKKLGIEIVQNKRLMMAGDLNIGHGHEFAKGFITPVNIARGFFLRAKANVMVGHHHRTSEHIEQTINDDLIGAWSLGCLSELHPRYMPINNWNHGFATVEVDGDEFKVENKKIRKGKVL